MSQIKEIERTEMVKEITKALAEAVDEHKAVILITMVEHDEGVETHQFMHGTSIKDCAAATAAMLKHLWVQTNDAELLRLVMMPTMRKIMEEMIKKGAGNDTN